jgi:hypothetical protein
MGFWASGTRSTVTIPAGAAANNQPIQIVHEQWCPSDLGVVVQSTASDPRYGTTTYNVTQVQPGSQNPALFQVPEGYVIVPTPARSGRKKWARGYDANGEHESQL